MLAINRREDIKTYLLENQSATVAELSKRYDVSAETIRRDFESLQEEGFLTKTYGGAVLKKHVQSNIKYDVLAGLFLDNKKRMAKTAADLISSSDCIFIDHLTTTFQMVHEIREKRITVMSNSIKVLSELSSCPSVNLVAAGGILDPALYSFTGSSAIDTIRRFHMDKAFISCRALDTKNGLSDKFENEADVHRAIIENADEVYLLADFTKFDKSAFVHICGFDKITAVITDHRLSDDWKNFLTSLDIKYYECL